jgi:hypothetical protein
MPGSRLADAVEPRFGRHETFAPRFGWLHKAYGLVRKDNELFHREDASVLLGVGKNMVNAMRYWSQAFKLTIEHAHENPSYRALVASPTWRARWLFHEDGADPYLEDTGSLWLLHWWLLSASPDARCLAPSWYITFHLAPLSTMTAADLAAVITRHVNENFREQSLPSPESVNRDVDCLVKMYALGQEQNPLSPGSFEDSLMSPFRELGLLEQEEGRGKERTWRFTDGPRVNLPAPVLAYACLDYASSISAGPGSISLARLANEPGAPGRAFRISEPELAKAIKPAVNQSTLQITESLGQRSLSYAIAPQQLAWDVLDAYYGRVRKRTGFPSQERWASWYPGLSQGSKGTRGQSRQTRTAELIRENA